MKVELHIDELILEGVPNSQREQVAAAIEQALIAMLTEQGLPPAWQKCSALAGLTEQVQPESRPDVIGQRVAQAILGNANAASQSVQVGGTNLMGMSMQNRSK